MNFEQEFNKQWEDFVSTIESELIRNLKESNRIQLDNINKLINTELNKWMNPSNYKGVFFSKLIKKNPSIESELKKELANIRVETIEEPKKSSPLPHIGIIIASGLLTYLIGKDLLQPFWKLIGVTLIVMFIIGSVAFSFYNESKSKQDKQKISQYMEQIDKYKSNLLSICEKA